MNIDPAALPVTVGNAFFELSDDEMPETIDAYFDGQWGMLHRHTVDERPAPLDGWPVWYDRTPAKAAP